MTIIVNCRYLCVWEFDCETERKRQLCIAQKTSRNVNRTDLEKKKSNGNV